MIHLRLLVVDSTGQPVRSSKKRRAELAAEIMRADPSANVLGKVAIVPLKQSGYYATLDGHIRNFRRLLSREGMMGELGMAGIANTMVHLSYEEIGDVGEEGKREDGDRLEKEKVEEGSEEGEIEGVGIGNVMGEGDARNAGRGEGAAKRPAGGGGILQGDGVKKDSWLGRPLSRRCEVDADEVEEDTCGREDSKGGGGPSVVQGWGRQKSKTAAEGDADGGITEEERAVIDEIVASIQERGDQLYSHSHLGRGKTWDIISLLCLLRWRNTVSRPKVAYMQLVWKQIPGRF